VPGLNSKSLKKETLSGAGWGVGEEREMQGGGFERGGVLVKKRVTLTRTTVGRRDGYLGGEKSPKVKKSLGGKKE